MIMIIRSWVLRLTGACILSAVATSVTPEGRGKGVVRLVCSFVVLSAFISPLRDFNYVDFSQYKVKYMEAGREYAAALEDTDRRLLRDFMESQSEEYIMDKAKELGIGNLNADVEVKWSDEGYWYPWSSSVDGQGDISNLSTFIESSLGIPKERQTINGS
ncbi:MAG: hypothetical protein IJG63_08605 [Oscillospiraceae bacterium]|nr:hypothetical protein [Oscillospiraceae bacterium]